MKKKIISLCLVVMLLATAVIGGTLAYFTDKDSETNVMTIGNIDIDLREWQWNEEDEVWDTFQDKSMNLYPIDNAQGMGLLNKLVQTKNISESGDAAYIRTIIAIEDWYAGDENVLGVHWSYYVDEVEVETYSDIKIDDQEYDVLVFTNKAEEKAYAKDAKQNTIYSVWFDKDLTQEQIAKYFGEELEILVLAQGIQATGLTHDQAMTELGEITSENLSAWFDTTDIVGNVIPTTDDSTSDDSTSDDSTSDNN